MKKMIIALLATLPVFNATALDCSNVQTQSDMNKCATETYKKIDNQLNKLYENILKSTHGKHTKILKNTQKKWIEYRDTDCGFQTYLSRKSSIYPVVYAYCLENKTRERVNEFKKMLNCQEGDISCPLSRNGDVGKQRKLNDNLSVSATKLIPDDLNGLIPDYIVIRDDLNKLKKEYYGSTKMII